MTFAAVGRKVCGAVTDKLEVGLGIDGICDRGLRIADEWDDLLIRVPESVPALPL